MYTSRDNLSDPRCATCDCKPDERCKPQSERDYREMVAKRPRVLPHEVPEFDRVRRKRK